MNKETNLLKLIEVSKRFEAIETKDGNQQGIEFEQEMQRHLSKELEKHRERKYKMKK